MNSSFSLLTIFKDLWLAGQKDWGNIHPLVVHFPFALLLLSPFFILCGQLSTSLKIVHFRIALILMATGFIFILLSTVSGELASEHLSLSATAVQTLELHLRLAEQSRLIFGILTAVFAIYVFNLAQFERMWKPQYHRLLISVFLLAYCLALLILGNAAHQGGKLVHHLGIKSALYQQTTPQ